MVVVGHQDPPWSLPAPRTNRVAGRCLTWCLTSSLTHVLDVWCFSLTSSLTSLITVAVRAGCSWALVGVAGLVASGSPCGTTTSGLGRRGAFRAVNDGPDRARPTVWPVMQLGSLAAVPVSAGVALLAGRRPLAVRLAVAGGWRAAAAKVVERVRVRGRPARLLGGVHVRGTEVTGGGFVSGHAVAAARSGRPVLQPAPPRRPVAGGAGRQRLTRRQSAPICHWTRSAALRSASPSRWSRVRCSPASSLVVGAGAVALDVGAAVLGA